MVSKELLEEHQKVAYQIIFNAFKENKVSQAFLLSGEVGTPVFDFAMFIAKSLICNNDILSCDNCTDCLRIENGNYADLIIVDGSKDSIKKEDIDNVQKRFNKSAIEKKGIKIYIINLLENCATASAVNSLLKFLEEPTENTYAIITTNNINGLLPTIISRCQVIRINNMPKEGLIKELLESGFSNEDCNILSSLYTSKKEIEENIEESNFYQTKDFFIEMINNYLFEGIDLNFSYQTNIMKELSNSKMGVKMFLSLMDLFVKDLFYYENGKKINFVEQVNLIEKCSLKWKNKENILKYVIEAKESIERKANATLIIDKMLYQISQEGNYGRK